MPPTDRNIRKGAICCVVNNQTLGFKLWVRGKEEGAHGGRRHPDHLFFGAVTALRKNTVTARPADWRSPSIRGITHNKNRFNRNDSNCNHLITQSPARVSLPNLLCFFLFCFVFLFFFLSTELSELLPWEGTAGVGGDTITSINLPGARCIFITNIIGIQITEQASMSHPSTMDQLG